MRAFGTRLLAGSVASTIGLLLAGCGGGHDAQTQPPPRPHVVTHTSTFPLYRPSRVIDTAPIDMTTIVLNMRKNDPSSTLPAHGSRGVEVVAATTSSDGALRSWLHALRKAPPQGLHPTGKDHFGDTETRSDEDPLHAAGVAAETFASGDGKRTVIVFVLDPHSVRKNLGGLLDVIDQYDTTPGMMRGPIDDAAKKMTGYSVSEMLDRNSPFGMVLAVVKEMQSGDERAIVLVDTHDAGR